MSNIMRPCHDESLPPDTVRSSDRRRFLKQASGTTIAALALGGAVEIFASGTNSNFNVLQNGDGAVDLGSGDIGILNYAYALEQLEAAFYSQVTKSFYSGASAEEQAILAQIRDHEIAHREFFKVALGKKAIPGLQVNFSSVDFTSRDSVLNTAKTFEDLGVSAYNGAGQFLTNPKFLLLAGKIVSVEARHAAVIRDLLSPNSQSFAGDDVVDPATGLDPARRPAEVLQAAAPFIRTSITANNLPTA